VALPQQNRLRSSRDFARVHHRGARAATQHLAMRALRLQNRLLDSLPSSKRLAAGSKRLDAPKRLDSPKILSSLNTRESADGNPSALSSCFGISISRKVSKRAVVRNRIKRQIKAIIRRYLPDISPGWRVVIVVRSAAVECEFDDFLRELEYLLKKLKILT
jgi:ribonuclease P protein component